MKKLLLVLITALISACAAPGPLYEPLPAAPAGYATVVFMREPGLGGAAWPHHYYIDKKLVAKLSVLGYTYVYTKPGTRELHHGANAEYRGLLITVRLLPGETYYFKEGRHLGGIAPAANARASVGNAIDTVHLLSRDEAEREIKTYGYQDPEVKIVD